MSEDRMLEGPISMPEAPAAPMPPDPVQGADLRGLRLELDRMAEEGPNRWKGSMRKLVRKLSPEIRSLLDMGYSQQAVVDAFHRNGADVPLKSFRVYLSDAEKTSGRAGTRSSVRKWAGQGDDAWADGIYAAYLAWCESEKVKPVPREIFDADLSRFFRRVGRMPRCQS